MNTFVRGCIKSLTHAGLVLGVVAFCAAAEEPKGSERDAIETVSFADIDAVEHTIGGPGQVAASDYTVIVFINTDCPIANAYQPELARLFKKFSGEGVDMIMVQANRNLTEDQAQAHRREYDIKWSVALDPQQQIARRMSATTTPEAFVVDAAGKTRYRGRIDDRYVTYGKKRPEPSRRDLELALSALLSGQQVELTNTQAVGCKIFYSR